MNFLIVVVSFWLLNVTSCAENHQVGKECVALHFRIGEMIKSRLGVSKVTYLSQYEIEGWPPFVSLNQKSWDAQALKDIESVLDSLVFKKKSIETARVGRKSSEKFVASSKKKLLTLLLARFRESTGFHDSQCIYWCNFHVKGWPVGVTLKFEYWRAKDILAVYHQLSEISWELVKKNEGRTVTYADGTVVPWDQTLNEVISKKRPSEMQEEEPQKVDDFRFDQLDDHFATIMQNEFDDNIPRPSISSSSSSCSNDLPGSTNTNNATFPSLEPRELKMKCIEMDARIRALAMQQLNLQTLSDLNGYEIENWPKFLTLNFKNWDERAIRDIEAALPALYFKEKQNSSKSRRSANAMRTELSALLLDRFQAQMGETQAKNVRRISWCRYHVIGWPRGVCIYNADWTERDVLAIYRVVEGIRWKRVRADEIPTITYTDGTIESIIKLKDGRKNGAGRKKRKQIYSDAEVADFDMELLGNFVCFEGFESTRSVHTAIDDIVDYDDEFMEELFDHI